MERKEERLFVGLSKDNYLFRRIDGILSGAKSDIFSPAYYALLPKVNSRKWHTTHDDHTFRSYGNRLVAFQQPVQLQGFPVAEIVKERYVVSRYMQLQYDARMALRMGDPLPGYTIKADQPLTYVFIYELPKFVLKYGKDGWMLKPTSDFGDIINELEENFCSEKETEQRYRNLAPLDFDDYHTIGCGHPDD